MPNAPDNKINKNLRQVYNIPNANDPFRLILTETFESFYRKFLLQEESVREQNITYPQIYPLLRRVRVSPFIAKFTDNAN
jgi:hypothetical protein